MLLILELAWLKIDQVVELFCIWLLKIGVVISKQRIQKEIFPSLGVSKGPILSTKMTKNWKCDDDFNQIYQSKGIVWVVKAPVFECPFNLLHLLRIFAIDQMKLRNTLFNNEIYYSSFPSFTVAM